MRRANQFGPLAQDTLLASLGHAPRCRELATLGVVSSTSDASPLGTTSPRGGTSNGSESLNGQTSPASIGADWRCL